MNRQREPIGRARDSETSDGRSIAMSGSVQHRMATGALWTMCFKLGGGGLGIVSTLILSRMLAVFDFGAVAIARSCKLLAQMVTSFAAALSIADCCRSPDLAPFGGHCKGG